MIQRIQQKSLPILFSLLTFLLVFSQFLEIYQITHPVKNLASIAALCLIAGLIPYRLLKLPVFVLTAARIIYAFVPLNQDFSLGWFSLFTAIVQDRIAMFLNGEVAFIPIELALVVVISLITLLIELQIEYSRFLLSTVINVGYLLLMATYNDLDLSWTIVFVICNALFLRLLSRKKKGDRLMLYGGVLLLLLFSGALYLPRQYAEDKLLEVSADVRTKLNQAGFYHYFERQKSGIQPFSRTGFSENDDSLGGPLLDDHQILFEAQQRTGHYWRVESKGHYTGKGWINSSSYTASVELQENRTLYLSENNYQGDFGEQELITLDFQYPGEYLPVPYGNLAIQNVSGASDFHVSSENGRIDYADRQSRSQTEIQWLPWDYELSDLVELTVSQPNEEVDYLQLPGTLSEAVKELALEITDDEETLLEQVTAVESYLKLSGTFRYSKMDAHLTPDDQDYVEHFLFDSQVGYCDNFSSSMVVLLRTLGIPARWVKGFTPGSVANEGENQIYTVRNSDAHSWVEVFFEGFGWLPFEPTPTFSQPLNQEVEDIPEETEASLESEEETQTTSNSEATEEVTTTEENSTDSFFRDLWNSMQGFMRNHGSKIGFLMLLVTGILFWRWSFYLAILFLLKTSKQPIVTIYPLLLKKIEKQVPRPENQPLSQYAEEAERALPFLSNEFIVVTKVYEKGLYSQSRIKNNREDLMKSLALKLSKWKP